MGKIIAICGKICSGKTYYARQLRAKEKAVILSTDEATCDLIDNEQGEKYDRFARRMNAYFMKKSAELAEIGCTVILDWGFWTKAERQAVTRFYQSKDIPVQWHYVDVDDETWEQNIARRNQKVQSGEGGSDFYVDEGLKQKILDQWEEPDESEIDIWYRRKDEAMAIERKATLEDLESLWNQNIAENPGDSRWVSWKEKFIAYNQNGQGQTFAVLCDGHPVGEGTLLFSPACSAIAGRTELADHRTVANINALRIRKEYEGKGHISALVRLMEQYAAENGYTRLTIGVEAQETRNLGIYLHWGYNRLVHAETEDGVLVLYYAKDLKRE